MVHGYRILGIDEIFESLMPLALASGPAGAFLSIF
jgi:hypothetical protein